MGRLRRSNWPGGIVEVRRLLDTDIDGVPLQAYLDIDCARQGLLLARDLGTPRLGYHQAFIMLEAPAPGTEVARVHKPKRYWTDTQYLLAQIADSLSSANWQRGHGKGSRPKPIPRPGVEDSGNDGAGKQETVTGEATSVDAVNDLMAGMWGIGPKDEEPTDPVMAEIWGDATPTDPQQLAVDEYAAGSVTYADLAAKYDVSASTIGRWVRAASKE